MGTRRSCLDNRLVPACLRRPCLFWCRTGAGAPMASPGGSCLRSEAQQTDEGWQAAAFYFKLSVVCTCSPTLIRPFGPPSPGGKALAREHPSLAPLLRGAKDEGGERPYQVHPDLELYQASRERFKKTEAVFLGASRGLRGGNRNPPGLVFFLSLFLLQKQKKK